MQRLGSSVSCSELHLQSTYQGLVSCPTDDVFSTTVDLNSLAIDWFASALISYYRFSWVICINIQRYEVAM